MAGSNGLSLTDPEGKPHMPEVYRRVVLKPAGLSVEDSARLRERLAAAVELQQQLASQSPHVLQLVGGLEEDDRAFFVQHEPARALKITELFDSEAPLAGETQLLRTAVALADALRAAHGGDWPQPIVHGGLCGGAVLETSDGVQKLTDFGFAPGICAALGVESYLELALEPNTQGPPHRVGTGVWEVLSPDLDTRDDRICGFIDPEKYGNRMLETFEPGSDIIAAGILLHLLAEHRHPLLEDPEDHRMVAMAESMAWRVYDGRRRRELRESTDPQVQRWCELVGGMLARIPKDRPSASDIVSAFAKVGVKPVDAGEALRRRLEATAALIENGEWEKARKILTRLVASSGAPADVAEQAHELLQQCDAHRLVNEARARLKGDDWQLARESLDQLSAMSALPAEVAEQADKLAARLRRNLEVQDGLDGIEAAFRETTTTDPASTLGVIQSCIEQLDKLPDDKTLVSPLGTQRRRLRDELLHRREELTARIKELEAEHAVVNEWFDGLEAAWEQERWADVETLLQNRPSTPHWPKAVKVETEKLEKQHAEVKTAHAWVERIREAMDAENVELAEQVLANEPPLTHVPATLRKELDELKERVRVAKAKAADHILAQKWIERVERAVTAKDWRLAARQLAARPSLDHWPPDVLEIEDLYRPEIEKELEEQERQHLEIEAWLYAADHAAQQGKWDQAVNILETPPVDARRLPKQIRQEADKRKKTYLNELREIRRRQLEEGSETVRKLAGALVRDVITKDLPGLLAPEAAAMKVGPIEWKSEETPTHGHAQLSVAVRAAARQGDDAVLSSRFAFELDADPPRIRDDDGAIRTTLSTYCTKLVKETQKSRVADLVNPLRKGLFPNAGMEVKLDEPVERTTAAFHLLDVEVPEDGVETELTWDSTKLIWTYVDAAAFVQRAVEIAVRKARELVKPKLLEQSAALRRYGPVLTVDVQPAALPDPSAIPASLTIECRLAVHPRGVTSPQQLAMFPVLCPQVGKVVIDADLKQAETTLRKLVVAAQNSARDTIERNLKAQLSTAPTRIKLAALTRKISRPVDQIQFELRPKRGHRVTLVAPWSIDAFDFELLDDAQAQVDELLRLEKEPAHPSRKPTRKAFALTAAAAVLVVLVAGVRLLLPGTNGDRPLPSPTIPPIVGDGSHDTVADASANIDGSVHLPDTGPTSGETLTKDEATDEQAPEDRSDDEEPAEEKPGEEELPDEKLVVTKTAEETTPPKSPQALRPIGDALEDVRAVLVKSKYLTDGDVQELAWETGDTVDDRLGAKYLLPGLTNPERSITLNLDADQPALSEEDQTFLQDGVDELDGLLANASTLIETHVKQGVVAKLNPQLVDIGRVYVRLDPDLQWNLDADRKGWSANDVGMTIVFKPASDSLEIEDVEEDREIELGHTERDCKIADGTVTPSEPQPVETLTEQVLTALDDRQSASRETLIDNLKEQTRALGATVISTPVEGLEGTVDLSVEAPRFASRRFTVDWDKERLDYRSDPLQADIDRLLWAHDALLAIDRTIAEDEGHWVGTGLRDVSLFESSAPGDEEWILAVAAPWAAEGSTRPENPDNRLPIPVRIPRDWGRDDLIQAATNLEPPDYWPLIRKYMELRDAPYLLTDADKLAAFTEDLEGEMGDTTDDRVNNVISYLSSAPSPMYVIPRFELVGDGQPEPSGLGAGWSDGKPIDATLKLIVAGRFGLKSPYPTELTGTLDEVGFSGLDDDLMALAASRQPDTTGSDTISTCTLTLAPDRDASAGVAAHWSGLDRVINGFSATVAKAEELNRLLESLPERAGVEESLFTAIGGPVQPGGFSVPLDAVQAYEFLKRIWVAKGIEPSVVQTHGEDLDAFSVDRQEHFKKLKRRGFSKGTSVVPTIFVEYFCGPRAMFAFAWSVKHPKAPDPRTIQEGPFLIHLGTTASMQQTQSRIGDIVLDPVLEKVSDACAAAFNSPFDQTLGLVLAPDERMAVVNLAVVEFRQRRSRFKPLDSSNPRWADYAYEEQTWTTLNDLRTGSLEPGICDYALVPALLSDHMPPFEQVSPARQWAITELDEALLQGGTD
ncbi:MAG: hypothetical protein WBE26_04870 [Phycisphaerae bacterium]